MSRFKSLKFSSKNTPAQDGFKNFNKYFNFIKNIDNGAFGKVVLAEDIKTK